MCDAGRPRNATAAHVHGYLTRDGAVPAELLRLAREELVPYGVEFRGAAEVVDATCGTDGASVTLADGTELHGRKLLLATAWWTNCRPSTACDRHAACGGERV